ncbi:thymidylate synthase [Stenotrophomonas phage A1432]|uniref:thymidylate synthase n=1 Tax=Stenotrophomonas phage A1432 TaxID=2930315 RepID=A0A9E7SQE9_9CAUD|nr:thymidylate synthase [Stenotrophomonas phage A1432]UTC27996.1 thymidylate synthase [Stenotrophomonas phage A1432]
MSGVVLPFHDVYGSLIAWALIAPVEHNERTGKRIAVCRGGTAFRVDLSAGLLPTIGFRKTFPKSAAAEVAWYIQGSQNAEFITKYAPLWDKFVEDISYYDQGENGLVRRSFRGVQAAYGYRWRNHFDRDQLELAIDALRQDPTDRRVYVSAWDPAIDGLGAEGQKNVPCPTSFTFSVQDGELHSSLFLRSSDLFVGLPYDVMGHALLMDAVAHELGIKPGVMHVTLAHAHLYDVHWDMAREMLRQRQEPVVPALQLPGWKLSQIEQHPDDYVIRYAEEAKQFTWPVYNPKPEVVE